MGFKNEVLKKWRENQGLSQIAAARILEVTQPYLCELESGKKEPSFSMLEAISRKTGLSLDEFSSNENPQESSGERTNQDSTTVPTK